MKRTLTALLLAAAMLALTVPALAADTFSDVPASHWAHDTVAKANELGLLQGVGGGSYDPDGAMTRAAFVTVAVRAIGKDAEARENGGWYEGYYTVAERYGLIQSGEFRGTPGFEEKSEAAQGVQTWKEGEQHNIPQVGDKITTKSGQTYTIEMKYGVLGANVDADIWTGVYINGYPLHEGGTAYVDGTNLIKDSRTGQVHSTLEWKEIKKEAAPSGMVGDYDGEVYNDWYKWNSELSRWQWMGPNLSGK